MCVCVFLITYSLLGLQCVLLYCQGFVSMEFSRQEYWSGESFPSPGDLPNPGIKPGALELQADALPSKPPGKPSKLYTFILYILFYAPISSQVFKDPVLLLGLMLTLPLMDCTIG